MTLSQQLEEFSPIVDGHVSDEFERVLSVAKLLATACEDMSKSASISSRFTSSEALTEAQKILRDVK